jgi:hypothetical protein
LSFSLIGLIAAGEEVVLMCFIIVCILAESKIKHLSFGLAGSSHIIFPTTKTIAIWCLVALVEALKFGMAKEPNNTFV